MSRTPEETARLAATVTVETPSGSWTIKPKVIEWGERRILSHAVMPGADKEEAFVYLAADLAEARASDASRAQGLEVAYQALAEARAELAAMRPKAEAAERWEANAREYIDLLTGELAELGAFVMARRGEWSSTRYEKGRRLRAALGIAGMGEATPPPAEEPREVVEPAPAPARWRCEGCGEEFDSDCMLWLDGALRWFHWYAPMAGCGPVVPVTDAQPGAADGEAG